MVCCLSFSPSLKPLFDLSDLRLLLSIPTCNMHNSSRHKHYRCKWNNKHRVAWHAGQTEGSLHWQYNYTRNKTTLKLLCSFLASAACRSVVLPLSGNQLSFRLWERHKYKISHINRLSCLHREHFIVCSYTYSGKMTWIDRFHCCCWHAHVFRNQ